MSKVLIDRALLERAVYSLELAYESDTPTIRDIAAVLVAPSGTPVMPVKAYYHESPNEYGGFNKSVGLEQRKTFADAPLVLESDALAGFAARDARIAEIEADRDSHQRCAIQAMAELAAIKAQEPLTVEFMQFMTAVVTGAGLLSCGKQSKGLASELSATAYKYMLGAKVSGYQQKPIGYRCWFNKEPKNIMVEWGKSLPSDMNPSATYQELYAAPVSEAKAQGVVLDGSQLAGLLEQVRLDDDEAKPHGSGAAYWNNAVIACQVAIRDALAAPVQQVSVPDGKVCVPVEVLRLYEFMAASFTPFTSQHEQIAISLRKAKAAMLAAPVQQDQAFCEYCGGNDEEPQDHCMDCTRPVQQVSVPDGFERYRLANKFCEQRLVTDDHVRAIVVDAFTSGYGFGIAAAPAAPAADAGLVEALKLADWSGVNIGNKALISAAIAALAAHRAKGVV